MSNQDRLGQKVGDEAAGSDGATVSSRRDFLRVAGTTAAGVLLAPAARASTQPVAPPRVIGANDRINVGVIGCGGRGMSHVRMMVRQGGVLKSDNIQVIAVCDIYEPRKERARSMTGGTLYHEYRKLLENKDVDAVVIATPEHWHARMAIDALEAGKDLYLEKPMVRYLDEARKLYLTAKRTGRVVQVGSQASSQEKWYKAHDLVQAGKIGKPVWSQTSYCRNSVGGEWNYRIEDGASPDNLDWKAFLGSAPKRAFDKDRFFRWRKYWDYSAGITSDLFPHVMHPLFIAMDLDFPTRVTATGGTYVHPDREVPDTIHLMADFPSGHTMVVAGSTANEQGLETMIRGHKANMYLGGSEIIIRPERTYAEEIEESRTPAPGGESTDEHFHDFFRCVRSREKPHCNVDLAYRVHVTVGLAEMAFRQNKIMRFDPKKVEVILSVLTLARAQMATRFELVLCGDDPVFLRAAGEEALDEVARLEAQLSLYRPDSELSGINARAAHEAVAVEPCFFALLERIAALSAATEGAFDPTVAPLLRLWRLGGGMRAEGSTGRVPDAEALDAARERVGMQHVLLDRGTRTVRFARPGMCLDLGAVGKGYAIERAVSILREAGVAAALLHAGTSTVAALGAPPGEEAWSVAIRHPVEPERHLAHVRLRDRSLSVSAPHGKAFVVDGLRYGHVLDPRTGCPVQGALLAAVVSASATESDALSTALLALGAEGAALLQGYDPECWGLVVPGGETMGVALVGDPGMDLVSGGASSDPGERPTG